LPRLPSAAQANLKPGSAQLLL